jgi:hypothetical protein
MPPRRVQTSQDQSIPGTPDLRPSVGPGPGGTPTAEIGTIPVLGLQNIFMISRRSRLFAGVGTGVSNYLCGEIQTGSAPANYLAS